MKTWPRVGRSMSAINFKMLLLPAPEWPVKNASSPLVDLERHAGQGLASVGVALVNLVEANHAAGVVAVRISAAPRRIPTH